MKHIIKGYLVRERNQVLTFHKTYPRRSLATWESDNPKILPRIEFNEWMFAWFKTDAEKPLKIKMTVEVDE